MAAVLAVGMFLGAHRHRLTATLVGAIEAVVVLASGGTDAARSTERTNLNPRVATEGRLQAFVIYRRLVGSSANICR